MTFGGGAVATIMGGIAAEDTGGDFAEGALTAINCGLYFRVFCYYSFIEKKSSGSLYAVSLSDSFFANESAQYYSCQGAEYA